MTYEREAEVVAAATREAGAAIARQVIAGIHVTTKSDATPVTDADAAANAILTARLRAAFPDDAILSEEVDPDAAIQAAPRCWIVDPLDGTAGFVHGDPTYAVMVALEIRGRPQVGAVYNPVTDECYAAVRGGGATVTHAGETRPFRFAPVPYTTARLGAYPASFATLTGGIPRWTDDPGRFTVTPTHFSFRPRTLAEQFDGYLGWLANGLAGGGYPWDLCATDLIIHEAGGVLTDAFGRQHRYRRLHERMYGGIVAACDSALHAALLARLDTEG